MTGMNKNLKTLPFSDKTSAPITISPPSKTSSCTAPLCQCPVQGLEFVCLPCYEIYNISESCAQLDANNTGCSIKASPEVGLEIIKCGTEYMSNFVHLERSKE